MSGSVREAIGTVKGGTVSGARGGPSVLVSGAMGDGCARGRG